MTKTMTIEQLIAFAATAKFTVLDENNGGGDSQRQIGYTDDGEAILEDRGFASASRTLTAVADAITVTYSTNFEWAGTENSRVSEEVEEYPEAVLPTWTISGVTLIDDDGDELGSSDTQNAIEQVFGRDTQHDMTMIDPIALIPALETNDIDIEENMEVTELDIDGAPNIRFTGEVVASVSSKSHDSTRWTVLTLYKTKGGKFICHSKGYSNFIGESTRYSGTVASDAAGVIAFFGHGRLAKELYDDAEIENVQDVD